MDKIIITSDSTCDLPVDILREYDVRICPISILLGNEEKFDTVDVTSADVLDFIKKTCILPKTSAVSADRYAEFFKKYVDDGYKVIHFCISSKASSCYEHAEAASKNFEGVYVIDSYSLSSGQGLQILKTADMIKSGMPIEEIVAKAKRLNEKVQTSFVVDKLDFLHKGGRCSSVAVVASKIMKIHPSISIVDGTLQVKKKYVGALKRSIAQYIDDLAVEYKNYDDTRAVLIHSPSDAELVEYTRSLIESKFNFRTIIDSTAGSTVTSHCGYNTIGLMFCLTD